MHDSLDDLPLDQLARMLDPERLPAWPESDAAAVLRHQLAAPLLPDLASVPGAQLARLEALIRDRAGAESFLRQLTFLHPSLELLDAIKQFARHVRDQPENPLHEAPATVLYFAAIAAALVRCRSNLTQLGHAQLRDGFAWAEDCPGAEQLRHVFSAALARIASPDNDAPA